LKPEAEIIAKAGNLRSVTIATNMAGRGTDIKIPEEVKVLGGLAVLGSERHEARRIDNQLRGRSGRQGDPGYSRFYISMEDDLMRRFGAVNMMKKYISNFEGKPITMSLLSKKITSAQTKIEGINFDIRKHILQYDDVIRQQRNIIYKKRDEVLNSLVIHEVTENMFYDVAKNSVETHITTENKEEFLDLDSLIKMLESELVPAGTFKKEEFYDLYNDSIIDLIAERMYRIFEANKQLWGEEIYNQIQRHILIRSIDMNWTSHIDAMSKLREGISLRAYAQTNPLQAYVNEGYQRFQTLMINIANQTCLYCLKAQIKVEKKPVEQLSKSEVIDNIDGSEEGKKLLNKPRNAEI